MAQEKTEKATPKRRQKAREEGQVAKSTDFITAITLFSSMLFLNFMMGTIFSDIQSIMKTSFTFQYGLEINPDTIMPLFTHYLILTAKIISPFLIGAAVIGALATLLQVGTYFNIKVLKPKFNRINPIKGFKDLFSLRSFVDLLKALFKISCIVLIAYLVVKGDLKIFFYYPFMELEASVGSIAKLIFKLGMTVSIVLVVLGVADFLYQRYEFEKGIRMSKQEIKEEYKEVEGDPLIMSKRRERMRQLAMNRMIQEVPQADVIITNPTHISVAIKYDIQVMDAPIVLAMGADKVAAKIREIGKEHKIEIVENKPLARALYETAEIGAPIPVELYQAVAEVLAFVYRLQKRKI